MITILVLTTNKQTGMLFQREYKKIPSFHCRFKTVSLALLIQMDEADVLLSQSGLVHLCKLLSRARFAVQRKSEVNSTCDLYMGYRSAEVWHFIDMPVI